jgi:hypothetical protein
MKIGESMKMLFDPVLGRIFTAEGAEIAEEERTDFQKG